MFIGTYCIWIKDFYLLISPFNFMITKLNYLWTLNFCLQLVFWIYIEKEKPRNIKHPLMQNKEGMIRSKVKNRSDHELLFLVLIKQFFLNSCYIKFVRLGKKASSCHKLRFFNLDVCAIRFHRFLIRY